MAEPATVYANVWGGPWDGQRLPVLPDCPIVPVAKYGGDYCLTISRQAGATYRWTERRDEEDGA